MNKTILTILFAASSLSANAAMVINGTTATATSNYVNRIPTLLVNGSGLTGTGITATHVEDSNAFYMWHAAGGQVTNDQFVTITLGGTYDIESIYIWQMNQTANFGRGVDQFDLLYSTDGVNFLTSSLDNHLAISTGGAVSAQQFAMSHTGVTHVRIAIDSAHSGAAIEYVGLSEVMITAVPEPGVALLGGLGLLGLLRRRRN